MTALPSIRHRLSRLLLGVGLAWALAVSAAVWLAVRHGVDSVLDGALQESAEILYGLLNFHTSRLPLDGAGRGGALPAPAHAEHLVWQIVGADGRLLLRSHKAPPAPLLPHAAAGLADAAGGWRVYALPYGSPGRMLLVAQSGRERHGARLDAAWLAVLAALLVGGPCALLFARLVRRELQPLQTLSAEVAGYQPLAADARPPAAGRAELLPLRDAVVSLGERLARRVSSERAIAAHAAHALRTPLAGLSAQLAVAQREGMPALQPHLQRAREAAERLRRVVGALITLFRVGAAPAPQPVDLAALVRSLPIERLALSFAGDVAIEADPDLIAAALLNLLDNSLRHGASRVQLTCRHEAAQTVIGIVDDGPGVSAERRAALRAALAQQAPGAEGIGLGLLLADQVARAHGGELALLDLDHGFGLELRLRRQPETA